MKNISNHKKFIRKVKNWNKLSIPYARNSLVKFGDKFYISLEEKTIVEPNDRFSNMFYVKIIYILT